MRVLLIGSGAREHALLYKLEKSPLNPEIIVCPGNPAIARQTKVWGVNYLNSFQKLIEKCLFEKIDLVICGPEQPLVDGLGDAFREAGILFFGPGKEGAQLEGSKYFAKKLMRDAGIPSADFVIVQENESILDVALKYFQKAGSVVLKADGLASGKGVFVCHDEASIKEAVLRLNSLQLKTAAKQVLIEECLIGREVSHFSLICNHNSESLGFVVDYKRLRDGNLGPNTGGMGAYTPVAWLPVDAEEQIQKKILRPLLQALNYRQINYQGFLYIGLMWTVSGPKVIEYNVRLGDPEAQVLAMSDEGDWLEWILEKGSKPLRYPNNRKDTDKMKTVAVVMANAGYPFDQANQFPELDLGNIGQVQDGRIVFAASVVSNKDASSSKLNAGSGRVLSIVAKKPSFLQARSSIYDYINMLKPNWPEVIFRTDIAMDAEDTLIL
ncbi:MAG: phosphoribosylamine--glycine ligase [Oligoflexales bacterium]|nr:phosphoribosylamine--glycine ligase [Oligoflexales bacterium]